MAGVDVVQVHSVYDLFWRDKDVCGIVSSSLNCRKAKLTDYTKVFRQTMTYKYTTAVNQHAEFLVDYFQRRQRMSC